MNHYVMDASAWLRMALLEQEQPEVLTALRERETGTAIVQVPELFVAEVANVIQKRRRKGELTGAEATALLGWTLDLELPLCSLAPLAGAAMRLAWEHRLSVYDAMYLALAIGCGARLLTADDDLARAARLEGCA
jgi:predicted nucleic acid-binding protein